jgi:TonB-dependent starch-binding outer membrane protein SusC
MGHDLPNLINVLRLLLCLSCCLVTRVPMFAQNYRPTVVAVESEKTSLSKILFELEDAFHVSFNYDYETVRNIYLAEDFLWKPDEKLEDVLTRLLSKVYLKYERLDGENYLILGESRKSDSIDHSGISHLKGLTVPPIVAALADDEVQQSLSHPVFAVDGTVREENGDPLPGVNVIVKGTNLGTTTDANGFFKIETVNGDATLVFSFVGYAPQEISINRRTKADVVLSPDVQSLEEVIVTGYNTTDRRDVIGSVVTVKGDELKLVPANNFAQQLQGLVAGVVVSNDNSPGGGVAVRIRGIGSVTGSNDPLYVIDGVPTTGSLNQLNPNDIESMQVLKDAAAASIYGARANNGVIVITTKRAKPGSIKVNYSMYEGVQSQGKAPAQLNSREWVDILWAEYKSRGLTNPDGTLIVPDERFGGGVKGVIPDYILSNKKGVMQGDPLIGNDPSSIYTNDINDPAYNVSKFAIYQPDKNGFDWYDATYDPAPIRNHNLSLTGGSEQARFVVSADYYQHTGIVINNSFKRYSFRTNTEFQIKDVIRIGENVQISYTDAVGILLRDAFSPVLGYMTSPYSVPYDIAGNYVGHRSGEDHSISTLTRNKDNHGYTTRIFGNIYLEADILKNLTARTSLGLDYSVYDKQSFNPKSPESDLKSQVDQLTFEWNKGQNLTWTNTINYKKHFKNHYLQFLAGTEAVTQKFRNVSVTKNTLVFDDPSFRYLDAATQIGGLGGLGSESSLFSIFGKIDYKFRNRYLFTGTVRRDASSRFAPKNRWGTFPAFGVGWMVSEESFMQSVAFVNSLKLRAGWGITGNQDIDPYNQFTTYAYSNLSSSYPLNGGLSGSENLYPGYEVRRIGNTDAQWEEQSMINLGVDVTLFSHLSLTAEWYNRETSKLLLIAPAPATAGQNGVAAANVGEVRNRGIDISLNYEKSATHGLSYTIGLNWSKYNNTVTSLYDASDPFITGLLIRQQIFTRTQIGKPLSSFYGMINDGIFRSVEEADAAPTQFGNRSLYNQPGRLKYRDINNDGIVNGKDATIIGNPHPKFTYGINLTARYKGFDFTMFLIGVYGNDIYNFQRQGTDLMLYESNKSKRILDYWRPENPDSNIPTPNQAASAEEYYRTSTYFVEKGSYLRAKNIQVGYTLPTTLAAKIRTDRVRIFLQTNNLFTITEYLGTDPEINVKDYEVRGNEIDRGVDRGVYPAAKTYMVGVQLGF